MKTTKNKKIKIINFLNKYWMSRGVKFGEVIFNLQPKNKEEWINFLKTKAWYLLKQNILSKKGIRKYEIRIWCKYLIESFWKLYLSENNAINFFSKHEIKLKRSDWQLDKKYGIDFEFNWNNEKYFLIVKNKIFSLEKLSKYKPIDFFNWNEFNLLNSTILVFESLTNKLFFLTKNNFCENLLISSQHQT